MTNSDDLFAKLQALSPDERAKALAMLQSQSGGVNLGQGNAIGQMGDANAGSVALSDDARINGVAVGVNLGRIVYGRDPAEDERRRLVWYLTRLANKLYRLPLRGVEERLDQGEGVALPQVYVMLATTTYKLLDETEYTPLPLQHYFQEDVKAVFDSFELFEEYGGGWSEIFGAAQTDYDEEFALPNRAVLAYNFENSTGIRYYSVERAMLAMEVLY